MEEATTMTIVAEEDDDTLFIFEGHGIEAAVLMSKASKTGWRTVNVDASKMFSRDIAETVLSSIEQHLVLFGWGKNNEYRNWRWKQTTVDLDGFMYETSVRSRASPEGGEEE